MALGAGWCEKGDAGGAGSPFPEPAGAGGGDGHRRAASRSAAGLLESPQAGQFGFFPSYTTEDVGHSSPTLSSP